MEVIVGIVIGLSLGALFSGAIIWVVGKLGLGLSVDHFGWAALAGLMIGLVISGLQTFVVPLSGIVDAIVHLLISAVVILGAGKLLKGFTVNGFGGALVAALAIAGISYLIGILFGAPL